MPISRSVFLLVSVATSRLRGVRAITVVTTRGRSHNGPYTPVANVSAKPKCGKTHVLTTNMA